MNCDSQNDPGEDGFVMTKALPGYDSRSESLDSFRASFTLSLFAVHQQSSLSDLLSMPEELWGDVEDDPPSLESLPIDESLDEPEDSSIQVVMTSYSRSLLDVVLIPPLNARFCLIDRKCWGKNRSGKFLIYSNDLTAGLLGWMNVTSGDTPYTSASTFEDLNLSPELLRGIYSEMKFERPSKIQAISLPMILTPPYKNLIAQAHNGSGKTTCFVLGMLSRVDPKLQVPQALCICPTRELAIQALGFNSGNLMVQNLEVLRKMGKHTAPSPVVAVKLKYSLRYSNGQCKLYFNFTATTGEGPGSDRHTCSESTLGFLLHCLLRDSVDGWLVSGNYSPDKPGAYDMDINSNYIPFTEGREGTLETLPIMIYIWDFVAVGLRLFEVCRSV
ncbi:DEAD-box ATP-dependent RNA helicase 38 [Vitis vinifera]|uniref:ATP-dependent RNA helicase n=1 Tax=Vitis vinifera TaxID=29760 RepID=A0A438BSF8_VITVI|nr:DEAD-box ATP-dependent RNA helicase 38 [Vitis vinifera]